VIVDYNKMSLLVLNLVKDTGQWHKCRVRYKVCWDFKEIPASNSYFAHLAVSSFDIVFDWKLSKKTTKARFTRPLVLRNFHFHLLKSKKLFTRPRKLDLGFLLPCNGYTWLSISLCQLVARESHPLLTLLWKFLDHPSVWWNLPPLAGNLLEVQIGRL